MRMRVRWTGESFLKCGFFANSNGIKATQKVTQTDEFSFREYFIATEYNLSLTTDVIFCCVAILEMIC